MNINYLKIFIQYFFIVAATFIIYQFIKQGENKNILVIAILFFSVSKLLFFCFSTFRQLKIITKDMKYLRFLWYVALNIFYLIFSFSLDYFLIYSLDKNSFTGVEGADNIYQVYFKFFYLSFLLFTNMGVANVIPVAIPAEILVMFEAIASFSTIIFILSDFVTLKDSFSNINKKEN